MTRRATESFLANESHLISSQRLSVGYQPFMNVQGCLDVVQPDINSKNNWPQRTSEMTRRATESFLANKSHLISSQRSSAYSQRLSVGYQPFMNVQGCLDVVQPDINSKNNWPQRTSEMTRRATELFPCDESF